MKIIKIKYNQNTLQNFKTIKYYKIWKGLQKKKLNY